MPGGEPRTCSRGTWKTTSPGSVRRARALQDVMLPELDHSIYDVESRLEELEQEDAIWMRRGAQR